MVRGGCADTRLSSYPGERSEASKPVRFVAATLRPLSVHSDKRRYSMPGNSIAKTLVLVSTGLLLAGCGRSATEPRPQPPDSPGMTYVLTIQRAHLETIAGTCDPQMPATQPFVLLTHEEEGVLRMERINGVRMVWSGTIDAEGHFSLQPTEFPTAWTFEHWTADGSLSADRSSLTGTEEFRGDLDDGFCHAIVAWTGAAG